MHEDSLVDCVACQYGKLVRKPFPQTTWKATRNLQLVHKYYITFIDDYTIFCWIYFFKSKSEVANFFWKYKALVENQSGCMLQTIRFVRSTRSLSEIYQRSNVAILEPGDLKKLRRITIDKCYERRAKDNWKN